MIRIWISRASSVPVREQLSAQLLFGILSRRLAPGERLPSVRDLARRIRVHSNTVSAAYHDLAARGWVKRKAGSGVFVGDVKHEAVESGVEAFVRAWIEEGIGRGFTLESLRAEFDKTEREIRAQVSPTRLMVVHPDGDFARILAAEIEEAVQCSVLHAAVDQIEQSDDCMLLTTASGAEALSRTRHRLIPLKSMEEVLAGFGRPSSPTLIALVSRSPSILKWASLLIPALGLTGCDMIERNPARPKWRDGLAACDLIAADVVAAAELPKSARPIVLRLVADAFLEEVRQLVTAKKV